MSHFHKTGYEDMIDLPHHTSPVHPRMSMEERAAQFSPFAALTGYENVIQETGRKTVSRAELGESRQEEIKEMLDWLAGHLEQRPEVAVTYFVPDARKAGGAYVTKTGRVRRMDHTQHFLIFEDGTRIYIPDIQEIGEQDHGFY